MCGVLARQPRSSADVHVSFKPLDSQLPARGLKEEIDFYGGGGADKYLDDLNDQLRACSDPGVRHTDLQGWTYSALAFPSLGDGSFAYSATAQEPGLYDHLVGATIRRGNLLAFLSYYSIRGGDVALSATAVDQFRAAAQAADRRLAAAQRQLN